MRTFPLIHSRPYVIYSVASSIDGKTATKSGDTELSDEKDWFEVHQLRSEVDAILVGKNTILQDDSKLTLNEAIENNLKKFPYRVVLDSSLSILPTARVIQYKKDKYKTIIASCKNSTKEYQERKSMLEKNGAIIIEGENENQVEILDLMSNLKARNINSIMLEGGGTLAWSFLKLGMVDEIRLFIAPILCGGSKAISIVMGEGFDRMIEAAKFSLIKVNQRGDNITLHYKKK